tara:strand:- start:238 stop:417 length:180 start_codon:yes stop_codon:yes gene_type:complete
LSSKKLSFLFKVPIIKHGNKKNKEIKGAEARKKTPSKKRKLPNSIIFLGLSKKVFEIIK